jgi:putative hemolysin
MDLLIAIIGLLLSFIFAGSEAAFNSFNKIRLDVWKKQINDKKLNIVYKTLVKKPENFFSSILIGNNIANTLTGTFATIWLLNYFGETAAWLIVTAAVLFWGEVFPKSLFRNYSDKLIRLILFVIYLVYFALKPFIKMINSLVEYLSKLFKIDHQSMDLYFSRDELELLIRENYQGIENQEYVENILEFSTALVKEAVIPRTELTITSIDAAFDEVIALFMQIPHPFILVYKENYDNITGAFFFKDLFIEKKDFRSCIKELPIVPENKTCTSLLRDFQKEGLSIALVVDEHGDWTGIASIDNLVEEVFRGYNIDLDSSHRFKALNAHSWQVDARMELDYLQMKTGILFEKGEYETVAGYLLAEWGRIPANGEILQKERFRIEVIDSESNKINSVKIIKKN